MMYAALTSPHISEIKDHNELFKVLDREAAEEGKLAAQKGTAIHAAIERWFQDGYVTEGFEQYIVGTKEVLHKLTGINARSVWKTEEAVTHPLGFGTRIDLYSTELNCIVDFKGKEFGPEDQVKGWPEQAMQLAAGREMVRGVLGRETSMRCINVFISRNNPGLVKAYEWDEKDIQKAWKEFRCLLEFWKIRNNME